jgi:hypothetical protein
MSNVGADRGNDTFVLTHGRALFVPRPSLRSSVKVNTLRDWHGLVLSAGALQESDSMGMPCNSISGRTMTTAALANPPCRTFLYFRRG